MLHAFIFPVEGPQDGLAGLFEVADNLANCRLQLLLLFLGILFFPSLKRALGDAGVNGVKRIVIVLARLLWNGGYGSLLSQGFIGLVFQDADNVGLQAAREFS